MDMVTRIRDELKRLIADGAALAFAFDSKSRAELEKELGKPMKAATFKNDYQEWYTKAYAVVRDVLPHRLGDFRALYQPEKRRSLSLETYGIADYIAGLSLVGHPPEGLVATRFWQQLLILRSCEGALDSAIMNIRQLVHADFLDSELEEARELHKHGFRRAAGALAGVALERHLAVVIAHHQLSTKKKAPSIAELNDALKAGSVYDVPTWRFISRLGDLRNVCDHDKKREPTADEINELISGVEKIVKTVA